MNNNINRWLTVAILTIFLAIIAYGAAGAARATQTVGNVYVTNSGFKQAIPVAVMNTHSVNVTNGVGAPVNTATLQDRYAFQQTMNILQVEAVTTNGVDVVTVPTGRRLIIDYVDDESLAAFNGGFTRILYVSGPAATLHLQPKQVDTMPAEGLVSQPAHLVLDQGQVLRVSVTRAAANASGWCNDFVTVQGHWSPL